MAVKFANPWWVVAGTVTGLFVCNSPVLGFTQSGAPACRAEASGAGARLMTDGNFSVNWWSRGGSNP